MVHEKTYATLRDILTDNVEGLKGIFDDISNGVSITDENSIFIYANPAFTEITGYALHEIIGENPGILHSGKHGHKYYQTMWEAINAVGRWQNQIWNRRKSGEIYPELLTITRVLNNTNKIYYVAIFTDISILEQKNKKQINLAFRDPLTSLCNRGLLEEKFNDYVNKYKRSQHKKIPAYHEMAVLFMDLNQFKSINDRYGHFAGDKILIFVAKALTRSARSVDTIARYGGDEFVVLLSNIKSKNDVIAFSQRLENNLKAGKQIKNIQIIPTVSIGVSFYPTTQTNYEQLIQQADEAMYYGKTHHNFLSFYTELP